MNLDWWIYLYDQPQKYMDKDKQGNQVVCKDQYKSLWVLMQSMLLFYKELNKKLNKNMHGFTRNPYSMFVSDQGIY